MLYAGDEHAYRDGEPVLRAFGSGRFVGPEPGAASSIDVALLAHALVAAGHPMAVGNRTPATGGS